MRKILSILPYISTREAFKTLRLKNVVTYEAIAKLVSLALTKNFIRYTQFHLSHNIFHLHFNKDFYVFILIHFENFGYRILLIIIYYLYFLRTSEIFIDNCYSTFYIHSF